MQRKSLTEQLREANAQLAAAYEVIETQKQRMIMFEYEVRNLRTTERRFDQLLEGMCMAMREGNLPRCSHG